MNKTDVSLNTDQDHIPPWYGVANKMRMELVWHNCKTCPPTEDNNDDLLLWDGDDCSHVGWDNGHWWDNGHYIDLAGYEDQCWWADLRQTTEGFFKR